MPHSAAVRPWGLDQLGRQVKHAAHGSIVVAYNYLVLTLVITKTHHLSICLSPQADYGRMAITGASQKSQALSSERVLAFQGLTSDDFRCALDRNYDMMCATSTHVAVDNLQRTICDGSSRDLSARLGTCMKIHA